MRDILRQLSTAFRSLARQPAVMVPAVLTLALGIGANTALFAYLAAMLSPTVEAAHPERIVTLYSGTDQDRRMMFSYPELTDLRQRQAVVTDLIASSRFGASVSEGERSSFAWGGLVTGNYFSFFDTRPALGRLLQPSDDRPEAPLVMVLSHRFWLGALGGDPDIVGRQLRVNGTGVTVVGVAEEGFQGMNFASAFYVPTLGTDRLTAVPRMENRDARWLGVFGRTAPGVPLEKAQAGLDVFARALDAATPLPEGEPRRLTVLPFASFDAEYGDQEFVDRARMLMGVASAFLLLGCVSIANLLLARAISKQREWGIRASLGASRGWLLSAVLSESLVLCLLGGLLGLGVAHVLAQRIEYFVMISPSGLGDWTAGTKLVQFDVRTALFAGIVTVLCVFLGALGPVFRVMRGDLLGPLKSDASASGGGGLAPRKILVVAQVALSVLLLLTGGLLARTLGQASRVDAGFDPDGLLLVTVNVPRNVMDAQGGTGIYQRVLDEARQTPGVASASLAHNLPVAGWSRKIVASALESQDEQIDISFNSVSPDYFKTVGLPVLAGRALDERDREEGPRAVVVSLEMAKRLWGDAPAVGRSVRIVDQSEPKVGEMPYEVVGVAKDVRSVLLEEPGPAVYFSNLQRKHPRMTLLVRSDASVASLAPALRRSLQQVNPDLTIVDMVDCREHLSRGLLEQRMYAEMAGLFALLGLGVAVLGLFGLLSYSVSLRGRELSIRMAVGARPQDVQRLVLRQGMTLVGLGVAAGLAGAFALSRAVSGLLYGVDPTDPLTFAAVPAVLALVSLLACYLPARRAARLDPTAALKG
ncbi:MAG TPA: ADOP family duplicated permease [Thermoanaerobaculia bacterium]|nr:ADOP family duplicated permease [Thermoanaerobaculia bacterium]